MNRFSTNDARMTVDTDPLAKQDPGIDSSHGGHTEISLLRCAGNQHPHLIHVSGKQQTAACPVLSLDLHQQIPQCIGFPLHIRRGSLQLVDQVASYRILPPADPLQRAQLTDMLFKAFHRSNPPSVSMAAIRRAVFSTSDRQTTSDGVCI